MDRACKLKGDAKGALIMCQASLACVWPAMWALRRGGGAGGAEGTSKQEQSERFDMSQRR